MSPPPRHPRESSHPPATLSHTSCTSPVPPPALLSPLPAPALLARYPRGSPPTHAAPRASFPFVPQCFPPSPPPLPGPAPRRAGPSRPPPHAPSPRAPP